MWGWARSAVGAMIEAATTPDRPGRRENPEGPDGIGSDVMPDPVAPREIAAAWQPQLPGRRATREIPDAIVEPHWGGARVVAALTQDEAALYAHGEEIAVPENLLRELLAAFGAVEAVIEGHLTTSALRSGEGAFPETPRVERPPILVPRVFRDHVTDDPYVRARDHVSRALAAEPATLEALEGGEPHAFVAIDLLWLDGQPLLEIPLLERKRLLETVLETSQLVRVGVFVRPSAVLTLTTWRSLGFTELQYRAANSRYLAGRENPDWAVGRTPQGPGGPSRVPASPR
jgi:hypothetical protein